MLESEDDRGDYNGQPTPQTFFYYPENNHEINDILKKSKKEIMKKILKNRYGIVHPAYVIVTSQPHHTHDPYD